MTLLKYVLSQDGCVDDLIACANGRRFNVECNLVADSIAGAELLLKGLSA